MSQPQTPNAHPPNEDLRVSADVTFKQGFYIARELKPLLPQKRRETVERRMVIEDDLE